MSGSNGRHWAGRLRPGVEGLSDDQLVGSSWKAVAVPATQTADALPGASLAGVQLIVEMVNPAPPVSVNRLRAAGWQVAHKNSGAWRRRSAASLRELVLSWATSGNGPNPEAIKRYGRMLPDHPARRGYRWSASTPVRVDVSIAVEATGVRRDPHNYVSSVLKPMIDGFVDSELVPDDTARHILTVEPLFHGGLSTLAMLSWAVVSLPVDHPIREAGGDLRRWLDTDWRSASVEPPPSTLDVPDLDKTSRIFTSRTDRLTVAARLAREALDWEGESGPSGTMSDSTTNNPKETPSP